MKTMTEAEIDQIVGESQKIWGAELQQFRFNEKALQLNFYKKSTNYWLTFSLKPGNPYFFVTSQAMKKVKSLKKPVNLFLKMHFNNEILKKIERDKMLGRIVRLSFENDKNIEFTLVPGRVNLSLFSKEKQVFASRPKELKEHVSTAGEVVERKIRPSLYFEELWEGRINNEKQISPQVSNKKDIKKKNSGLKKMEAKIESLKDDQWLKVGEWLKMQASLDGLPEKILPFIDSDKSLPWNIENCFSQYKKNQTKVKGTQERIEVLKKEILDLEQGRSSVKKHSSRESLLAQAKLKGKTIDFGSYRLFVGKSGADNLKLLRKAKPWYLWLHIKDHPGAYGILEKSKKIDTLSEQMMRDAAQAVIRQSLPHGQGGRFELIYTECRYVRPIKGAKSGQVTYSHEKVISVEV